MLHSKMNYSYIHMQFRILTYIEFKRKLKIYKIKELLLNLVKHSNVSYRSLGKDTAGLPEGKESTGLYIL